MVLSLIPVQTFTKTWDLKNVGTCAWTTAYQLEFVSGEQMGGAVFDCPSSKIVPGRSNVRVLSEFDRTCHCGFLSWLLDVQESQRRAIRHWVTGHHALVGGYQGIRAYRHTWWTHTATPSATPTGPTSTKPANTAYDFTANACFASWFSGAGGIDCTAGTTNSKGYVLKVANPQLENGTTSNQPGLLTVPQNIQDGYIQGTTRPSRYRPATGSRRSSVVNMAPQFVMLVSAWTIRPAMIPSEPSGAHSANDMKGRTTRWTLT